MNYKQLKLLTLALLSFCLTNLQAQSFFIKENSGAHTAYLLENVQTLSFSSGNLVIKEFNTNGTFYALYEIQYLSFEDFFTDVKPYADLNNFSLTAYPNPVSDFLHIDLQEYSNNATISIFSLEGRLMYEQKLNGTNSLSIDISQFPEGIYLCRYTSLSEIKTIKIIKQ